MFSGFGGGNRTRFPGPNGQNGNGMNAAYAVRRPQGMSIPTYRRPAPPQPQIEQPPLPPYNGMQSLPSQAPVSGGPSPAWQDSGFNPNSQIPAYKPPAWTPPQLPTEGIQSISAGGPSFGSQGMGQPPQNVQAFLDYLRQYYQGSLGGANG